MTTFKRDGPSRGLGFLGFGILGGVIAVEILATVDRQGLPGEITFGMLGALFLICSYGWGKWAMESYLVFEDRIERVHGWCGKSLPYDRISEVRQDLESGNLQIRAGGGKSLQLDQSQFGVGLIGAVRDPLTPILKSRLRKEVERGGWVEFREPSAFGYKAGGALLVFLGVLIGANLVNRGFGLGILLVPLVPILVAVYCGFKALKFSGSGLAVSRSGLRRRGRGEAEVTWPEVRGICFDAKGLHVHLLSGETPLWLGRGAWNYKIAMELIRPHLPPEAVFFKG